GVWWMGSRPRAITALLALACAAGVACSAKHGHSTTTIVTRSSFPQGLLPVLTGSGRGDVSLMIEGDLFAVDAVNPTVTAVSHTSADISVYSQNVGDGRPLDSITVGPGDDGRLFVGDDRGKIWVIPIGLTVADRTATLYADTGTGAAITGLAFAPGGF